MNKSGIARIVGYLLCFVLIFTVLAGLVGERTVLATQEGASGSILLPPAQEEPPAEEKLELGSTFPVQSDVAGESYDFDVAFKWTGSEFRTFELNATGPPKWRISLTGGPSGKELQAIGLDPEARFPETLRIGFAPLAGEFPEPGEYVVTLTASSGDITETIELKAVVTALYRYAFYTGSGRLNTKVTAGKENRFSVMIANTGTEVIEKIELLSEKPSKWSIEFEPTDEINNLEPGMAQELYAVIKPPREAIAGDYMVTMQATSPGLRKRAMDIRVTVLTPTVLGWIGIIIVLVVIAGLAYLFRRLGRR